MRIKQAVILAGGKGTRLWPVTDTIPKPMIRFHGKPFLEYLIDMLRRNGVEEVILLLGYLHEKVEEYFGDGEKFGVKIKYSIGPVERDAGARIKFAEELLDENFILLYCDNMWPLNLKKLVEFHSARDVLMTMTVFNNLDHSTKSNIRVDDAGYITYYDKTRTEKNLSGVDIGFFILNKKVVEDFMLRQEDFSLQTTIIQLTEMHKLAGFITPHKYYSVGSIERLPITEKYLKDRKIIFLDRDGVINKKAPKADYIKNWSEFEFLPGAIDSMKKLSEKGFEIYIISNQAGIARGVMSVKDLEIIHDNMTKALSSHGAFINDIYYCPHGWDEGCECRKPKPGMFYRAAADHQLNLTKSLFIGDDERDKEAGDAAGLTTILVGPENGIAEAIDKIFKFHEAK
ncbi:MAG: HAD-IIIA family hydrolase [Candidatus Woesearchaeota archaeon]